MEILATAIIIVLMFFLGLFAGVALEDVHVEDLLSLAVIVFIGLIVGVLIFFLALDISTFFL